MPFDYGINGCYVFSFCQFSYRDVLSYLYLLNREIEKLRIESLLKFFVSKFVHYISQDNIIVNNDFDYTTIHFYSDNDYLSYIKVLHVVNVKIDADDVDKLILSLNKESFYFHISKGRFSVDKENRIDLSFYFPCFAGIYQTKEIIGLECSCDIKSVLNVFLRFLPTELGSNEPDFDFTFRHQNTDDQLEAYDLGKEVSSDPVQIRQQKTVARWISLLEEKAEARKKFLNKLGS